MNDSGALIPLLASAIVAQLEALPTRRSSSDETVLVIEGERLMAENARLRGEVDRLRHRCATLELSQGSGAVADAGSRIRMPATSRHR